MKPLSRQAYNDALDKLTTFGCETNIFKNDKTIIPIVLSIFKIICESITVNEISIELIHNNTAIFLSFTKSFKSMNISVSSHGVLVGLTEWSGEDGGETIKEHKVLNVENDIKNYSIWLNTESCLIDGPGGSWKVEKKLNKDEEHPIS